MTVNATNDLSAFGRHAPRGWLAGLVRAARLCGADWAGRRLAFALRAVGIRALRGRPLDVESLGARMRLYPGNNVAEKNLLFTPQYFDPQERRLLAEKLTGDFVFIDIGANVGGYALFAAARGGVQGQGAGHRAAGRRLRTPGVQHPPERLRQREGARMRRGRPRRRHHPVRRPFEQGRDLDAARQYPRGGPAGDGPRPRPWARSWPRRVTSASMPSSSTSKGPRTSFWKPIFATFRPASGRASSWWKMHPAVGPSTFRLSSSRRAMR